MKMRACFWLLAAVPCFGLRPVFTRRLYCGGLTSTLSLAFAPPAFSVGSEEMLLLETSAALNTLVKDMARFKEGLILDDKAYPQLPAFTCKPPLHITAALLAHVFLMPATVVKEPPVAATY